MPDQTKEQPMTGWWAGITMILAFALIVATAVIVILSATGHMH